MRHHYRVDAVPALYAPNVEGRVRDAAFGRTKCVQLLQQELPGAMKAAALNEVHPNSEGG